MLLASVFCQFFLHHSTRTNHHNSDFQFPSKILLPLWDLYVTGGNRPGLKDDSKRQVSQSLLLLVIFHFFFCTNTCAKRTFRLVCFPLSCIAHFWLIQKIMYKLAGPTQYFFQSDKIKKKLIRTTPFIQSRYNSKSTD